MKQDFRRVTEIKTVFRIKFSVLNKRNKDFLVQSHSNIFFPMYAKYINNI